MARKSTVEQLPDEVLQGVNAKLSDGFTLDQIIAWLAEMGHEDDVSRSALGRYKMRKDELSSELKRSRMIAETIIRDAAGSELDGQMGRVAVEMLHSIIMKMTASRMSGRMPDFDPREAHFLARALKDSASALQIEDDRVAKIREKAFKEAADKVEKIAIAQGLSKEAQLAFRTDLLKLDVK